MTDLEPILTLWRELESAGEDCVLATVVAVEGSSYRRPGARMLIAADGRRTGTVSGGCLEAEVAKRAWWLTEKGPVVEQFSTVEDDGERPFGSGCGGMVSILLERRVTAAPLLGALGTAFERREPLAIATVIEGLRVGQRSTSPLPTDLDIWPHFEEEREDLNTGALPTEEILRFLADRALRSQSTSERKIRLDGQPCRVWTEYRPARPGLWIFGAGDDAKPLLSLARELGWFVAVSDGRSHLATCDRFPSAGEVNVLDITQLPGPASARLDLRSSDAAVVMTHSFEQDSRILAMLLALGAPLAYVGVLGPQRRTREMLAEAARLLGLPSTERQIEEWLASIYAPTGLDLGAETPAAIALSILSEIQQTLNNGSALPLRVVRAARLESAER
jgi:xanthine dehydrogenase accessory factor